ncbi:sirohydrochlorin cobaltochelatase CbiK [Candidatus Magnetoovum chiemensis]|nr:sirohydrochlorin cobaltochelatase CbiK [Candidatus Magnetoovum chiemensis]
MINLKLRKRTAKTSPALVIAAFGTTTEASFIYTKFDEYVRSRLDDVEEILWAYTSEIVRQKKSLPSILEALSMLEAQGYRKAAVQPLYVFPTTEYKALEDICKSFPTLNVFIGETLLHRWQYVKEVFNKIIAQDLIPQEQGINVVIAHGSELVTEPSSAVFLALERYLLSKYGNVYLSTIDCMPDKEITLNKIKHDLTKKTSSPSLEALYLGNYRKARLLPLIYLPGKHFNEDLIENSDSYKNQLEKLGFTVEYLTVSYKEKQYPKGLGLYDEIMQCFLDRILRTIELMRYY